METKQRSKKEDLIPLAEIFSDKRKRELLISISHPDGNKTLSIPLSEFSSYGYDLENLLDGIQWILKILITKGFFYKDSWKKRGQIRSIMANIDRKYDRLDQEIQRVEQNHENPEGLLEGAGDLGNYCFLYVFDYLRTHYPEAFQRWTEQVERDFKVYCSQVETGSK